VAFDMSAPRDFLRATTDEGTFLGRLPAETRVRLVEGGTILERRRGEVVFASSDPSDRIGVVLRGIVRSFMTADDGRRLSVRYARVGAMIGNVTTPRAALSVQAVSDCVVLEIDVPTLQASIASDGRIGLILVAEVAQRLYDMYATLASNTFGTMRERVARHLLDLSSQGPEDGLLAAPVTQQALADGVGTVREVVARILRDFREEGIIETTPGLIRIQDPARLAAIVGRDDASEP
jgi:CRP/FNR family transcriptional regulator